MDQHTMEGPDSSSHPATISVVITTFNQAHFLADAIGSVLAQTRPADEILVVDDGSSDDPQTVVEEFTSVRLIRQENRGLSAARNTGLRSCSTTLIVFLDADDLLLPHALETGMKFWRAHPTCAFVYGGHRYVSESLKPLRGDLFFNVGEDPHHDLMLRNAVGMHATVLYRRDCLMELDGFDETLRRCEDHDLYLRLTQKYQIRGYPVTVALYRRHRAAMTADPDTMLRSVLTVLDKHAARVGSDKRARAALKRGKANWRDLYVTDMLIKARDELLTNHAPLSALQYTFNAVKWSPGGAARGIYRAIGRRANKSLVPTILGVWGRIRGKRLDPQNRSLQCNWGFERGTPIDRYYIERFLARNASRVRGRILEVGDNFYTLRFGGPSVEASDILYIDDSNPQATIIGDLTEEDTLPEEAFDCIIFTQTLHLIFDMRAGIKTLFRALKPGGVLLLTTPGITPVAGDSDWGNTWYWSLTSVSTRRLLEEFFAPQTVHVEAHGNLTVATAFLAGRVLEEVDVDTLDLYDARYPVTIAGCAIKQEAV